MKRLLYLVSPLWGLVRAVRRHPGYAAVSAVLLLGVSLAIYHGLRQARARAHRQSAVRALARWDFRQAQADFTYCVEVWPGDFQTRYLAAHIARRAGFLDKAEEHLRECSRLGDRDPRTTLESALLRAQSGQVDDVEKLLLDLVAQDDLEAPLILEALALGYVHVYQLPKAGRCLDMLLERQPRNVFALVWRGHCLEGIGVQEKAIEDYRKAIAIDPNYDDARLLLADRLATRLKHYAEAIKHFQILHDRQPNNPGVAIGLARCWRLTGEGDKARRLLEEVLRAHPHNLGALAERGQLALQDGQPAEAERYLRPAAALQSPDREVLHSLYQALQQLGKKDEAKAALARGQRIDEDIKQMGEVLKGIGKNPQDASLYCRAAAICLRNGNDGEAVRWLQGALTRDPRYGPAHAALADYYERTGATALAAQHRRLAAEAASTAAKTPS
jgi:tetratricopeptide (TPR) repeat protein